MIAMSNMIMYKRKILDRKRQEHKTAENEYEIKIAIFL